jgi:hypothetical protein
LAAILITWLGAASATHVTSLSTDILVEMGYGGWVEIAAERKELFLPRTFQNKPHLQQLVISFLLTDLSLSHIKILY